MIIMGRRFMTGLLIIALTPHSAPARQPAAHRNITVRSHRRPAVSGRVSRNTDPRFTSLDTVMFPPRSLAFSSAIARPRPLPALVRAESAL